MRIPLIAYAVTAVVFLAMDAVWLSTMVDALYRPRMGALLLDPPRLGVAGLFYAIYVVGVVMFAVLPALDSGGWSRALFLGAAFGLFCYATYDLTNLSTLKGFPDIVAVVDIVWGMVVTGTAAAVGALVAGWIARG